jgi:hypothetical protein
MFALAEKGKLERNVPGLLAACGAFGEELRDKTLQNMAVTGVKSASGVAAEDGLIDFLVIRDGKCANEPGGILLKLVKGDAVFGFVTDADTFKRLVGNWQRFVNEVPTPKAMGSPEDAAKRALIAMLTSRAWRDPQFGGQAQGFMSGSLAWLLSVSSVGDRLISGEYSSAGFEIASDDSWRLCDIRAR